MVLPWCMTLSHVQALVVLILLSGNLDLAQIFLILHGLCHSLGSYPTYFMSLNSRYFAHVKNIQK
jgi:hypothetical protein